MSATALNRFISDPDITWYGPYPCPACLGLIIKASRADGGLELDCPTLVYPNTVWDEHQCNVDKPIVYGKTDEFNPGYH